MTNTLHIKPARGLKIRIPGRPAAHLPENGATVPATQFWLRRIADGSVAIVKPTAKKGGN